MKRTLMALGISLGFSTACKTANTSSNVEGIVIRYTDPCTLYSKGTVFQPKNNSTSVTRGGISEGVTRYHAGLDPATPLGSKEFYVTIWGISKDYENEQINNETKYTYEGKCKTEEDRTTASISRLRTTFTVISDDGKSGEEIFVSSKTNADFKAEFAKFMTNTPLRR